ncbi:MAG: thioredoxin domain-containing protein, partial [Acetobacteraceae bacterium]
LFQATGEGFYLAEARGLVAATERWFAAPSGAFFSEPADAADLPLGPAARTLTAACGVSPAGNGMMAEMLAALWHLTGEEAFATRAAAVIGAFSGAREGLAGFPTLLAAADLLENASVVVVAGDGADRAALLAAARAASDPAALVVPLEPGTVLAPAHPAFGKESAGPAAFVCRGGVCAPPVGEPAALRALLRQPAAAAEAGDNGGA